MRPIWSFGPGERMVLDLMDFWAEKDSEYTWVFQLKCHFSKIVWIKALKGKTADTVLYKLARWLDDNRCLNKL